MLGIIVLCVAFVLASGNPIPASPIARPAMDPFYPQGRIVGGRETTIEEHPWQVSLQVLGFHFCGGSIISEDTILTAGHCTVGYPASMMAVRLGSSRTDRGGVLHEVREIVRHENYKTNILGIPVNDVAVLKLKASIKLDNTRQPVPLFDLNEVAPEGVLSTISGWGDLEEAGASPDVLHTVDVPIVTKTECNKAYESWGGIPEGQICAAFPAGGRDTCQGDSGGPLVLAGRQAGIVSWGNGCARKGYPGVYTEIASFRDWIKEHATV
ncbi:serine protease 11 precursor [Nasonia vitripennis]|uniref:Peptidase S1 domain-containing protein n=1 Tax=Nasonia vitripennis TaxID=7425 RepID=A0A7M6W8G6_NASVI|nr:serine protease 11 precursor [Nasonia vitripennis]